MNTEFSITKCRQILGDAAKEYDDKCIEEIRDTFIGLANFVIDGEIEKSKLKNYENSYGNQISKS